MSTRDKAKLTALQQSGFDSYRVDIDQDTAIDPAFLDADTLIINITNKNLASFQRLVTAVEASPIRQLLFVSSSSVYQNLNREVTEDEGAENQDSPLFQIEQLLQQSDNVKTTVLRFSGLVGPGRHPGRFFRSGKTLKQPDAPINLIHLDDCIGIIDAIISQRAWGEVFNGCSDSHPKKRDFYARVCADAGYPLPEFADAQSSAFKIVSNNKIKQKLGYQFHHSDLQKLHDNGYSAG